MSVGLQQLQISHSTGRVQPVPTVDRLPLHPVPLHDEALHSWIERLLNVYPKKLRPKLQSQLGYGSYFQSNDKFALGQLTYRLFDATGVPPAKSWSMSEAGFGSYLRTGLVAAQRKYDINPSNRCVLFPKRVRPPWPSRPWNDAESRESYVRVCKLCLAEDHIPYIRRHWMIPVCASCPKHGVYLQLMRRDGVRLQRNWQPGKRALKLAPDDVISVDQRTIDGFQSGFVKFREVAIALPLWMWMRRIVMDEICRPNWLLKRNDRLTLRKVFENAGKTHRERNEIINFEACDRTMQRELLCLAAIAIGMMERRELADCGAFKYVGSEGMEKILLPDNC